MSSTQVGGATIASPRVLDAGCGRRQTYVEIPGGSHVVGIDVSQAALDLNESVDEKIVGDIQSYPLARESFDEILCTDVLEHLPHPELALTNMALALKPGGRLILVAPNPLSPKGLFTKLTPHRFHVWAYREILGSQTAGQPGRGPFETHLRLSMAPSSIQRLARDNGLQVESVTFSENTWHKRFWERHRVAFRLLALLWPFGDPAHTDFEMHLRKGSSTVGS